MSSIRVRVSLALTRAQTSTYSRFVRVSVHARGDVGINDLRRLQALTTTQGGTEDIEELLPPPAPAHAPTRTHNSNQPECAANSRLQPIGELWDKHGCGLQFAGLRAGGGAGWIRARVGVPTGDIAQWHFVFPPGVSRGQVTYPHASVHAYTHNKRASRTRAHTCTHTHTHTYTHTQMVYVGVVSNDFDGWNTPKPSTRYPGCVCVSNNAIWSVAPGHVCVCCM